MPDLSVSYLGLNLPSPIIVGSSGLTSKPEKVAELEKNGAGAVVLKSIFEEEILLEYDDEDQVTIKEFLGIIRVESERLTRLINDVLDLSRIQAGKMIYHDDLVSIEEIIREVAGLADEWEYKLTGLDVN